MALSADDRLEIMSLLARYNQAIDGLLENGADVWADTFTPHGSFTLTGYQAPANDGSDTAFAATVLQDAGRDAGDVHLQGRSELRAFAESIIASRPRQGYHWINNVLIEGDGDRAIVTAYVRAVLAKTNDAPEEVTVCGRYRDTVRKLDGEWKFERRRIITD